MIINKVSFTFIFLIALAVIKFIDCSENSVLIKYDTPISFNYNRDIISLTEIVKQNYSNLHYFGGNTSDEAIRAIYQKDTTETFVVWSTKANKNNTPELVSFITHQSYGYWLATTEHAQKRGFASMLINHGLNILNSKNKESVNILSWNPVAIEMYVKKGFDVIFEYKKGDGICYKLQYVFKKKENIILKCEENFFYKLKWLIFTLGTTLWCAMQPSKFCKPLYELQFYKKLMLGI